MKKATDADANIDKSEYEAASTMVAISQAQDNLSDNDNGFEEDATEMLLQVDDFHLSSPTLPKSFSRTLYFDAKLQKPSYWTELKSRCLPKDHMLHIISIYAFHSSRIYKLAAVPSRSNAKVRVYKCATCTSSDSAWNVTVQQIDPNDDNSLWIVRDNPTLGHCRASNSYLSIDTTRLKCSCSSEKKKRKISEQLFFNVL